MASDALVTRTEASHASERLSSHTMELFRALVLKESREASHGLLLLDSLGHILGWSCIAVEFLGYSDHELRGKTLFEFYATEVSRDERKKDLDTAKSKSHVHLVRPLQLKSEAVCRVLLSIY